jgi:hypothetical protein
MEKRPQRGDSQTVHLDTLSGLSNMHVEHFQPAVAVGSFIPAAAQLKPEIGAEGGVGTVAGGVGVADTAPGFGASQT